MLSVYMCEVWFQIYSKTFKYATLAQHMASVIISLLYPEEPQLSNNVNVSQTL